MHNLLIVQSLIGGVLIGLSAVMLMWLFGLIAGMSGVLHGLLPPKKGGVVWRMWVLLGLILGGSLFHMVPAVHFEFRQNYPIWLTILGGVLVGFGSRMGGGCTSGHGVCGIARLSRLSIVATCIFIVFGVVTVSVLRHGVPGVLG